MQRQAICRRTDWAVLQRSGGTARTAPRHDTARHGTGSPRGTERLEDRTGRPTARDSERRVPGLRPLPGQVSQGRSLSCVCLPVCVTGTGWGSGYWVRFSAVRRVKFIAVTEVFYVCLSLPAKYIGHIDSRRKIWEFCGDGLSQRGNLGTEAMQWRGSYVRTDICVCSCVRVLHLGNDT